MEAALDATYFYHVVIAFGLPALVALITKQNASSRTKAIVLAALSAVNGVFVAAQEAATGGASFGLEDWKVAVLGAAVSFGVSVVAHYGLLKPTGVTGTEGSIQTSVQGGIG